MQVILTSPDGEATFNPENGIGIPSRGHIIEWQMEQQDGNALPHGRYRVEEVVWHFKDRPLVTVFMTPIP